MKTTDLVSRMKNNLPVDMPGVDVNDIIDHVPGLCRYHNIKHIFFAFKPGSTKRIKAIAPSLDGFAVVYKGKHYRKTKHDLYPCLHHTLHYLFSTSSGYLINVGDDIGGLAASVRGIKTGYCFAIYKKLTRKPVDRTLHW